MKKYILSFIMFFVVSSLLNSYLAVIMNDANFLEKLVEPKLILLRVVISLIFSKMFADKIFRD